jgi:hypothetical protein
LVARNWLAKLSFRRAANIGRSVPSKIRRPKMARATTLVTLYAASLLTIFLAYSLI